MFVVSPVLYKKFNYEKTYETYKIFLIPFLSLKDHEEIAKKLIHIGYHQSEGTIHIINIEQLFDEQLFEERSLKEKRFLFPNEKSIAKNNPKLSFGKIEGLIIEYKKALVKNLGRCI